MNAAGIQWRITPAVVEGARRNFFDGLLTAPLSVKPLSADDFHGGRAKMSSIFKSMHGVDRCGKLVRVPCG